MTQRTFVVKLFNDTQLCAFRKTFACDSAKEAIELACIAYNKTPNADYVNFNEFNFEVQEIF